MSITTYTRDAYCKDCKCCVYYYHGKRKLHWCIEKKCGTTLKDKATTCIREGVFEWNPSAIPKYDSSLNK